MTRRSFLEIAMLTVGSLFALIFTPSPSLSDERDLKEGCLKATLRAIPMEIKRFEVRLKASKDGPGDPSNAPLIEKRISELMSEREKYGRMDPDAYVLPERKTVTVKVTWAYKEGSLIESFDISKSGPFYHIAGIEGNDYGAIEPNRQYRMTIYLVYPRDYPFSNHYVYVSGF